MAEYVYCLTNEAMPKLIKIGKTSRNPIVRAAEISASTGVPTPFEIAWARQVPDMNKAESALHAALEEYRVNRRREFFRCTPAEAMARAKKLKSFTAKKHSRAPRNLDVPMGLALTTVTLGIFSAAVAFDLEASTVATATAGFGLALTVIFQSIPLMRALRG